ncbi:hypothetical protein LR48_Vigan11g115700 [Vigna angularis]|uniref:Uncharacterized protein n=1 Tax=Phaseolus angularis TaxID=3914 RepID=A0A0L9VT52_PHAAN|nr:hypothetical protein LR48_Vigan11g115700 [Vigna angularis]
MLESPKTPSSHLPSTSLTSIFQISRCFSFLHATSPLLPPRTRQLPLRLHSNTSTTSSDRASHFFPRASIAHQSTFQSISFLFSRAPLLPTIDPHSIHVFEVSSRPVRVLHRPKPSSSLPSTYTD